MNKIRKHNAVGYEDVLRDLAVFEQTLLREDRDLAMRLMVLDAKIRERFQNLENQVIQSNPNYRKNLIWDEHFPEDDFKTLIPKDLPTFPMVEDFGIKAKRVRTLETVGTAAALAVLTALGVFGLASILHLALSWLA